MVIIILKTTNYNITYIKILLILKDYVSMHVLYNINIFSLKKITHVIHIPHSSLMHLHARSPFLYFVCVSLSLMSLWIDLGKCQKDHGFVSSGWWWWVGRYKLRVPQ